jgi:hypothetical protein
MNPSSAPYADDFFVAAIEIDGFIKPIYQMPYGRPFRAESGAKKEAKRFLDSLSTVERQRVERAIKDA